MRIRTSFVSNSSVSSFIIVGFKVTPEQEDLIEANGERIHDWCENRDLAYCSLEGYSYNLIGHYIINCDEDIEEISLSELQASIGAAKKRIDGLGIKVEPSIFTGMRVT